MLAALCGNSCKKSYDYNQQGAAGDNGGKDAEQTRGAEILYVLVSGMNACTINRCGNREGHPQGVKKEEQNQAPYKIRD